MREEFRHIAQRAQMGKIVGFFPDPDILSGSTIYVPAKIEREDKTWTIIGGVATTLVSLAAIL